MTQNISIDLTNLLAKISSFLINTPSEDLNKNISIALKEIGTHFSAHRVALFILSEKFLESNYQWVQEGFQPRNYASKSMLLEKYRWLTNQLSQNQIYICKDIEEVPQEAKNELDFFESEHLTCFSAIPVFTDNELSGWIEISFTRQLNFNKDYDQNCLKILANILMSAILRKNHEERINLLNSNLEEKVNEKTNQLTTLLNIQKALTTELHVDHIIQLIADEAIRLTRSKYGAVFLFENDVLILKVSSGKEITNLSPGYKIPLRRSIAGINLKNGSSLLIDDKSEIPDIFSEFAALLKANSLLFVPLLSGRSMIGVISVAEKETAQLVKDDEILLKMFANIATIALGNARLYQQEQERRSEAERGQKIAEALRDILRILNSKLELPDVLTYIANQSKDLLNATSTMVRKIDYENNLVTTEASANLPKDFDVIREIPFYEGGSDRILRENKPVVVSNLKESLGRYADDPQELSSPQKAWARAILSYFNSHLIVPLIINDNLYGTLTFYYENQQEFSEEDIHLALTLGTQVSLAIENARLRDTEREIAVAAERNRLARDLHDAVTQTLFSATLIAEVLPRLWDRNPVDGKRRLEELRQLTRGALAEMRTLLLELRPSALIDASLPDLMKQLCEALIGRSRLPVDLQVFGDAELPGEIKIAFYRIAQEALNNIAKHANPTEIHVQVHLTPDAIKLIIHDDGKGMIVKEAPSNHLGLNIMRERAQSIQAKLDIDSAPNEGTTVTVDWKKP